MLSGRSGSDHAVYQGVHAGLRLRRRRIREQVLRGQGGGDVHGRTVHEAVHERVPPGLRLKNPDDIECPNGGCDQSNTVTTGSVTCSGGDCIQTGITADGSISCGGGGCPQTGSTAKGGITCPDDPCAKCGEGGMTGRPRAFYSPPGQPPIPVPKARCAKGINGLTDCTDLCQKFPNAPHTTTCCKCYPAC